MCHCSFPTSAARRPGPQPRRPQPTPRASLENPEAWIWGGRPASLPGGGVWLAQDPWWGPPAPGPGRLAQVQALRPSWRAASSWPAVPGQEQSGPPEPPPLLIPLQALHKSSPTPPHSPQPTSRSPRGTLPVPFMFPLWGTSPSSAADSCLSAGPSSMAVVRPAAPPPGG